MEQQVQEGTHSLDSYTARSLPFWPHGRQKVTTLSLQYKAITKQKICLTLLPQANLCPIVLMIILQTQFEHVHRKSHKLQVYYPMNIVVEVHVIMSCFQPTCYSDHNQKYMKL